MSELLEQRPYAAFDGMEQLRIERLLPGPIERVWQYLTDSELRSRWLAGGPIKLVPGGRLEFAFRNSELTKNDTPPPPKYASQASGESPLTGRVLECEPPRRLRFTFGEAIDASEVEFDLSEVGAKVHLVVTHTRVPSRAMLVSVLAGWHTHLDILADRLAGQEPAGFWRTHTRLEGEYDRRLTEAGLGS